jgi:hypothetical protein
MDTKKQPFLANIEFPERLGLILRVVDGIAFHKNLLTLQRAVESAGVPAGGSQERQNA